MKIWVLSASAAVSLCLFSLLAGCASSPSSSNTSTPTPAVVVSSVSPATATAGAGALSLTVNGSGFTASTAVQAGGVLEPTTYVSSTQLTAIVPPTQLLSAGTLSVIASNGTSSSASGTPVNLTVDDPVPVITQLAPATFLAGSASAALTVTGTSFVPATVIQINGSARSTTYVSSTQVSILLTSADLAASGSEMVTAVNPAPGGGASAASSIVINNPSPTITSLSPATVLAGTSTATTVTISGTGLCASSSVLVGTTARATTYVSGTQITFQLTVADQATAGSLSISVVNPAPAGGTSTVARIAVAAPTPTPVITSLSPSQIVQGSSASTLLVMGTNLTSTSIVQWNGTNLTTTPNSCYVGTGYAECLYAAVPASLVASLGTANITVSSPTATPSLSNTLVESVVLPPAPTLTSLSPGYGPTNVATQVSLAGTGFTANSTVTFNGASIPATYVGVASLTVTIPAASLQTPGNFNFTVTTPAPGGGTSSPFPFTAYIGIANNSMVYNPVNGLFYLSVPGSAGAPYGNSIVSIDPLSGAIGTPIPAGSEPDQMAVTADGKYLWVGLDGASAVRQINLTTNTAGLQFSLGGNSGVYNGPPTVLAIAAFPGSDNSVVVSTSSEFSSLALAIYDSGVIRGTSVSNSNGGPAYALQVNGASSEIYAGSSTYSVYTYNSTGLTLKSTASNGTYANYAADEMQVANGVLYTDYGHAFDAEAGALLGTFYSSGTIVATGPTVVDPTLGRAFILDTPSTGSSGTYSQIQIFNTSNYTPVSSAVIPINVQTGVSYTSSGFPSHLTRWGTNGLAFRTSLGFFSLRSNLVKDLSSVNADLGVTLATSGSSVTGATTTYTAGIANAGPSASTNIAVSISAPSTGTLVSVTASTGSCSISPVVTCDIPALASGSSVTVAAAVMQTTAGSSTLAVQVAGSENDPVLANNQATSTVSITGSAYNLVPSIVSVSPAAILAGSNATQITVTGSGFGSASLIVVGGTTLSTNQVSSTQLTAMIPATSLASLGWTTVSVSTPGPGGGSSGTLPLSIYSVITLGANHILYDPYSRKIMASLGAGSAAVAGNSIVAITPETSSVGASVPIGSQPENLALTSDGQILYTILAGSQSVARFNMLTQQADFTYPVPANSSFDGGIALRGIATQPGTENTIALDIASFTGNAIYDFNPSTKTAAIRGQASGPYSGSCIQFLDAADLIAFDTDTSGATLDHYTVTSSGFTYYNYSQYSESTLDDFGCFKLNGGLAFANAGGVANPATVPATQIGVFPNVTGAGTFSTGQALAPDTSLQRAFFLANTTANSAGEVDGIAAFNQTTFLPSGTVFLNMPTLEGSTSYSAVDLIRWGQDGLAALTSGGHIYLLRGPVIVPQELNTNTPAVLTSSSAAALAHGSGNTLLTLTGSNFVPGVAVTWNGSYRTTTVVSPTQVTVAIPASDLTSAGTGSLVATNPGAPASSAIAVTIN